MDLNTQRQKAEAFRRMHDRSRILVLVNVWDAMSARAVEEAGARAIATSSATMAHSIGYADGEAAPRAEFVAAIARIARAVDAPVTADIESGFGRTAAEVAETITMVVEAGAVGINLEDGVQERRGELYEVGQALERLKAAREAAAKAGVRIVINARTDVFLLGVGPAEERIGHAVRRANLYLEAGADCLFVPGVRDAQNDPGAGRANQRADQHPGAPDFTAGRRTGAPRRGTRQRRFMAGTRGVDAGAQCRAGVARRGDVYVYGRRDYLSGGQRDDETARTRATFVEERRMRMDVARKSLRSPRAAARREASFELELRGPLDPTASLEMFRRSGDDLLDRWDGRTLLRTIAIDGRTVAFATAFAGTRARPTIRVTVDDGELRRADYGRRTRDLRAAAAALCGIAPHRPVPRAPGGALSRL